MKATVLFLTHLAILFSVSCDRATNKLPVSDTDIYKYVEDSSGIIVADTIIYDVVIRNIHEEDAWSNKRLERLNHNMLVDLLLMSVHNDSADAYDFFTNKKITSRKLKRMERKQTFSRKAIGKLQFTELWYVNEFTGAIKKRVHSVVLGYETYNSDSTLRGYKPLLRLVYK
jgi:hypothetical protein